MSQDVKATALILAEKRLKELGWSFTCKDIGKKAADMLIELEKGVEKR